MKGIVNSKSNISGIEEKEDTIDKNISNDDIINSASNEEDLTLPLQEDLIEENKENEIESKILNNQNEDNSNSKTKKKKRGIKSGKMNNKYKKKKIDKYHTHNKQYE